MLFLPAESGEPQKIGRCFVASSRASLQGTRLTTGLFRLSTSAYSTLLCHANKHQQYRMAKRTAGSRYTVATTPPQCPALGSAK